MLNATNALIAELLTNTFPAWLECEAVQYLLAFAVIGCVIKLVISFIR